jgi:50S ribosomal subunit-associated GTPase HflX
MAASSTELCTLLSDDGMRDTPCVVVLNKTDALHRLTIPEAADLLGLSDLAESVAKDGIALYCVACSAVTGTGTQPLLDILGQLARGERPATAPEPSVALASAGAAPGDDTVPSA